MAGSEQVEAADDEHAIDFERLVVDPEVKPVDLRAPEELRRALDDVGDGRALP